MNNGKIKDLCWALLHADSEWEVIRLMKEGNYWDNPALWRYYGDRETNYNQFGNQQSRPDAALVEKLVNSVDARLMNECLVHNINPESSSAPQSIREAVALFFEEGEDPNRRIAGRISEWPDKKRTLVARGLTLAATGKSPREGNPCFSIADCGEGQTPEMFPYTLVSLDRDNKLRIPFVQGKYNMGGTGVLRYCGHHNLQLIISRRNPEIIKGKNHHPSDDQWGFTVVRREDPGRGRRSSVYTYLAPLDADANPGKGKVLRFSSDTFPIFPEGRDAYARQSQWGTLIKLYEYAATGYSNTHILLKDGLLSRVNLLLPEVALPIRLYECRLSFRGHKGSFETTMTGLNVRLEDDKAENLEPGFPSSCPMSIAGEQLIATIYAFKKGRTDAYRKNEGIIFTLNGQTHGHFTPDFSRRRAVGLSRLADSIFVSVDCTRISDRDREDLFMGSRDRLANNPLRYEIERMLEDILKHHEGLRALREQRQREDIESRLGDDKPLEDVLKTILENSPTLSQLFLLGQRASNPFQTTKVQDTKKQFEGKKYPTFFKFRGRDYSTLLQRECHLNMRCRITFETDAVNDYFSRRIDPGQFSLCILNDEQSPLEYREDYSLNLQNGIASLSLRLPKGCSVGDILRFVAVTTDSTQIQDFTNEFIVTIKEEAKVTLGRNGRRNPPGQKEGDNRENPSGIQLPKHKRVFEPEWANYDPPFDRFSALRVFHELARGTDGVEHDVYEFLINMDNTYLKKYLKDETRGDDNVQLMQTRFEIGMLLVGLALLHQEKQNEKDVIENGEEGEILRRIEVTSRGLAPFLLPMIDSLGSLALDENAATNGVGEAT